MQSRVSILSIGGWCLTALVVGLAIGVWGASFSWQFDTLNAYRFFPVLGLVAYSTMWSQYMVTAANRLTKSADQLTGYFRASGWIVLVLIVLHPSILIYQRFRDGYGLPPHSYETFVAPSMAWITLLGSASLLVFLAYELHRWFSKRPWWKYLAALVDVAMLAIFYHGLRLGNQLQMGWYRDLWYFYGITLGLAIGYKYLDMIRQNRPEAVVAR